MLLEPYLRWLILWQFYTKNGFSPLAFKPFLNRFFSPPPSRPNPTVQPIRNQRRSSHEMLEVRTKENDTSLKAEPFLKDLFPLNNVPRGLQLHRHIDVCTPRRHINMWAGGKWPGANLMPSWGEVANSGHNIIVHRYWGLPFKYRLNKREKKFLRTWRNFRKRRKIWLKKWNLMSRKYLKYEFIHEYRKKLSWLSKPEYFS